MNFPEEYRQKVEDELKLLLQKGSTPLLALDTMNSYHMGFCDRDGNLVSGSKGKYLRPLFCIAMCAGLGGNPEQAIPAAAALELVHRTTLIFDDIQDKGQERNNQPSVWAVWGVNQAINAGLALSCYARLSVHRLSLREIPVKKVLGIQSVLENAVIDLCQGQYMDISFVDNPEVSVKDYLRMVTGKTATLFASSCAIGAELASPDEKEVPAPPGIPEGRKFRYMRFDPVLGNAWEFGLNIGVAFQIHDDYLGIWGDEDSVGKTANDLIEGKRTLPVIITLKLAPGFPGVDTYTIEKVLKNLPFHPEEAAYLKSWMEEKGVPERVKRLEAWYVKNARRKLEALQLQREWSQFFETLLDFLSQRKI